MEDEPSAVFEESSSVDARDFLSLFFLVVEQARSKHDEKGMRKSRVRGTRTKTTRTNRMGKSVNPTKLMTPRHQQGKSETEVFENGSTTGLRMLLVVASLIDASLVGASVFCWSVMLGDKNL